jgi:hypothetical protein
MMLGGGMMGGGMMGGGMMGGGMMGGVMTVFQQPTTFQIRSNFFAMGGEMGILKRTPTYKASLSSVFEF